jgi:hypothetical protein
MSAKPHLRLLSGLVAGLLALGVCLAFLPAVQTWFVRRTLEGRPGATIGRLALGFGHARARQVRLERDGMVLTLPAVDADLPILAALFGRGYHFRSLQARGWTLDLTHRGAEAAEGAGPAPSWAAGAVGGIMASLRLPAGLAVDDLSLEGDVVFLDATGKPSGRSHVVITGGGLAAGSEGRFRCSVTAAVDDLTAPVYSVAVTSTLNLSMEATGRITRAQLQAGATAVGRQFPKGIGLSGVASAVEQGGKQSFAVSLVRAGARVAEFDGENAVGSPRISGTWSLDLRDSDLAPFALGRNLPVFYVAGRGGYDGDASTGDLHAAGKLQASAERLEVISRALGALGHLGVVADFDMARVGDSLRVSRLETSVSGAAPVGAVNALQSFEFKPATGELKVADPSGDLVGITVQALPLGWLQGVLPWVDLAGGAASGEFVMRAEDGRLALRTLSPLVAAGVSAGRNGKVWGTGLEVSAFLLGDYAPQGWQLQLAPIAFRSDGTKILSVEARIGRLAGVAGTVKAAGSWSGSVPGLLAQPFAAGLPRMTAGDSSGNFEASLDSTREIRMAVALSSLAAAAAPGVALPAVASELRADIDGAGQVTFSVPLRLTYPDRSPQVTLAGTLRPGAAGPEVQATLSGTHLTADDLAALSALSVGGPPAPAARAGAPAFPAAPHAFWPDLHARFAVKLEELDFPQAELRDLRGTLRIEPALLAIEGATAALSGGSKGRLDAQVAFTAADPKPYAFKAKLVVENIDAAPYFQASDPGKPPIIEGRFALASDLAGAGTGPADLLAHATGTLRLTSKGGVLRALRADVVDAIKQDPSRIADAIDTVTSLFGKKVEKVGTALVETTKALAEIPYDQVAVSAERGDDLNLKVTEITMIAPEERLTGTALITYTPGVRLRDQPLSADLVLGIRGHLAKYMDIVGLLGDSQDELGYTRLYEPIHFSGTLAHLDQSQWRELLIQAPLRKGGGLIDKLLGR